jgi:hypothetical protein
MLYRILNFNLDGLWKQCLEDKLEGLIYTGHGGYALKE